MNEHTDTTKPYWVAKSEDNSVLHYGKIKQGQGVTTKLTISTFNNKEDFISFIESNGGVYEDQEIQRRD